MASLKQIAAELGISYTLVSKVLSGRMGTTGASDSTRKAILDKAKELDFQPNRLAVALKNGRRGSVGVFLHSMGVPGTDITHNFLAGLSSALAKSGIRLWLRFFVKDEEFLAACDENLKRDVDGLIVGGVDHPSLIKKLQEIDAAGLPIVSCYNESLKLVMPSNVRSDYEMQCYLTTKHLLERGCRRLAHFRTFDLRYKGFLRAHQEMGVPIQKKLIIPTDFFYVENGIDCAMRLLKSGEFFDGIVTEADMQAAGAMRVLLDRGIRVPEGVKITGVDNSPMTEICQVPLTSVTVEMEKCGHLCAEMLLKRIEGEPVESVTVTPRLVVRASSGG